MMLNHSSEPNCFISFSGEGANGLLIRRAVKNKECCISYGYLTNLELLRNYGFALRDNLHDNYELSFTPEVGMHICLWFWV
jgi:hypothetical protein